MMKIIYCICIVLLVPCLLLTKAAIYSSRTAEGNPRLTQLESDFGQFLGRKLSTARFRRSTPPKNVSPVVSEFNLENDTSHNQALIHWSGNNSKVIFILTRKKVSSSRDKILDSTLWRSSNYGKSYKLMTNAFSQDTILKSYFISPSNKTKMIFVDTFNHSSRIWLSKDEGKTFSTVSVPFSVEKIDFHPEISDWLLGYDKLRRELHCSLDFGRNWKLLGEEVTNERYFWYVKNVDKEDNPKQDPRRIVHFEYRHISRTIIQRIYKVKSCYVPDCRPTKFQEHADALENINMDSLTVQNNYVFVQKTGSEEKLYVSYRRGPFVKARFPSYKGHAQAHFHIISSDGECVMLGVNHDTGMTHLFVSDIEGKNFKYSLNHIRHFNKKTSDNKVFNVDAHEVEGVIGTYVANKHTPDNKNITYITWNYGQTWTRITQNVKGSDPKACRNCSLNLHLSMEQTSQGYFMQSIVAKKSFPGLILAHGTFGRTVVDNPNQVELYVSQDNGMTWRVAKKQRHFVVVANHGTVIVAVKMIFLRPVQELSFSYDYGLTWSTHTFTEKAVNVDGILTEPGERTAHMTLFGHETYAHGWRIFQIDMSSIFPRNCSYPRDFENFTFPKHTPDCHLGMVQRIERMKSQSRCLLLPNQLHVNTTFCDCTEDDYQCDLNYLPIYGSENLTCTRERNGVIDEIGGSPDQDFSITEENCSSGIRKIPGDRCKNDVKGIYKRTENCIQRPTISTTKAPEPNVSIQLLNETESAKVGDFLIFSVQGVSRGNVVWHVLPLENSKDVARSKVREPANFTLVSREPGPYKVRAELQGTRVTSDWILVNFWYPIKKVYLYHPPVVSRNKAYNVTAWPQTLYGLRGNHTLLGDVSYTWNVDMQGSVVSFFSEKNILVSQVHPKTSSVQISVTAENPVSQQSTSGKVSVKEFTLHLVLEMMCVPPMNPSSITDLWLQEFSDTLIQQLLNTEDFVSKMKKNNLRNGKNFFFYIPPGNSLKVFIYFAPQSNEERKENLLEAAKDVQRYIEEKNLTVLLANHMVVSVKDHYLIDYDGVKQSYETPGGGGLVALTVSLTIILLIIVLLVARRFLRKSRCSFSNLREASRRNRIVQQQQDREQLVEDEYIEEDLHTLQALGSTRAA